jgi:hypothetical protein
MSTRTIRGAGAAVLALGLITTTFGTAQAAPAPTPGAFTRAPVTASTGATLAPAGITEMASDCPTGQIPDNVFSRQDFEVELPYPYTSYGFTDVAGPQTQYGSHYAESTLLAGDPDALHFLNSSSDPVPQTGNMYLSFSYKGSFAPGTVTVEVNNDGGTIAPSPGWGTVRLDITSQATTNNGLVDVYFNHAAGVSAGTLDVDDVYIYNCMPDPVTIPNSGVRGDWTGEGTVDLLGTRTDGSLWVYDGNGNGTVKAGVKVGAGWAPFTWLGSPWDVNGDRRTDLLARRSDGTMWFYAGKGNGALGAGVKVGNGWNSMTSISTLGNFDNVGGSDLTARRTDGTLHLYSTTDSPGLVYVRKLGAGWNGMTSIVGIGDLNGDRRSDLVAVRADGVMFSYLATGTGLAAGKRVGAGWNALNQLTSPGDMTGDGLGDLVGRRADGSLWSYSGKAGGGVNAGVRVGGGWNSMLRIL